MYCTNKKERAITVDARMKQLDKRRRSPRNHSLYITNSNFTYYQAEADGVKYENNVILSRMSPKDGIKIVLDGDQACTTKCLLEMGHDQDTIMVVNDDRVPGTMAKICETLDSAKKDKVLTYKGDLLYLMKEFESPVSLVYADFTSCCPSEHSDKYQKYFEAIYSLSSRGCLKSGSVIAFTHCLSQRVQRWDSVTVNFMDVYDTLFGIFTDCDISVIPQHSKYTNTENGGKTKMAFTIFQCE